MKGMYVPVATMGSQVLRVTTEDDDQFLDVEKMRRLPQKSQG